MEEDLNSVGIEYTYIIGPQKLQIVIFVIAHRIKIT